MLSLSRLRAKSRSPGAEPFPQGIKVLWDPRDAKADIVFVHGLTGDRARTWTASRTSVMWPEDMLPAELPSSRILTFGYDAYITRLTMVSTNRISNHANDLLSALANVRGSEKSHTPLIFVAHSLGGLVTKDALLKSRNSPDAHLRNIFQSTKGIAFMGTPHSGSSLATWAKLPAKCLGIFKQTNTSLLSVLETDSEVLVRIQDDFLSLLRSREISSDAINITCFYETLPLPGVGLIVTQESAVLPGFNNISIHADHREMTRFSLKTDPGFAGVVGELKRWADDSNPQPQISVSVKLSDYEMKCLHLLAYADMESRLFAIDDPEGDTCQWLFSNAKYRKWCLRQELDLSHGLLWIKGKPGSGKSTLMKHAFLKTKLSTSTLQGISLGFFFNARGAAIEKTSNGLYQSLLHQLILQCPIARREFTARCKQKEAQIGQGKPAWSLPELRSFFHSLLLLAREKPVKIFIDALDECDEEEVRDTIRRFEQSAANAYNVGENLYICWSSRHYPHISISHGFELRMEDLNNIDIKTFVHQQLASFATVGLQELEEEIVTRASGVFLWTSLAIRRLFQAADRGQSKAELRLTLNALPPKLNDLFNEIYMSINERDRDKTTNLMRWVLFAVRPMTMAELRIALAISSDFHQSLERLNDSPDITRDPHSLKRYIVDISAGMCEVVGEARGQSDIVQVIHESVRDFFLGEETCRKLHAQSRKEFEANSHEQLFLTCRSYICMDEFCRFPPWKLMTRLPGYTGYELTFGFKEGHLPTPDQLLINRYGKENMKQNKRVIDAFWDYAVHTVFNHAEAAESAGMVQSSSKFGLLLQRWLWITDSPDANFRRDHKAIEWAISSRKFNEADLEKAIKCRRGLHPWLATVLTNLDDREELTKHDPGHALAAAAHVGLTGFIINAVRNGANINSTASAGQTALHEAAGLGHCATVRVLASSGADLEARDEEQKTALFSAARTGGPEAVDVLVELGAGVDAKDEYSVTPLMEAAKAGKVLSVDLLLAHGADIEAKNGFSQTPLAIACMWGHDSVVDLLIRCRADLESVDREGNTPLSSAAQYGHTDVIELLLVAGANYRARNKFNVPVTGWPKTSKWTGWPHLGEGANNFQEPSKLEGFSFGGSSEV